MQLFVDSVWFAVTAAVQRMSIWHSHLHAACKYCHAAYIDVTFLLMQRSKCENTKYY